MEATMKTIKGLNPLAAHGVKKEKEDKVPWRAVHHLSEMVPGMSVRTLAEPRSGHTYGKSQQEYHGRLAKLVHILPGNKLVRLHFEDGAVLPWRWEDCEIDATEARPFQRRTRPVLNPATSSPGGTNLPKADLPSAPPPPAASNSNEEAGGEPAPPAQAVKVVDFRGDDDEADPLLDVDPVRAAERSGEWVREVDSRSHKPYWWHHSTRETTWDLAATLAKGKNASEEDDEVVSVAYPQHLLVRSVVGAGLSLTYEGSYQKDSREVNGMPMWHSRSARAWLYSTVNGCWAFTNTQTTFPLNEVQAKRFTPDFLVVERKHNGDPPTKMGHMEWVAGDNGRPHQLTVEVSPEDAVRFTLDVFYAIHCPEEAAKVGMLVKKILQQQHSLEEVIYRACRRYQADYESWSGSPPKALVQYRITEYLKSRNVSHATWSQLDEVVNRASVSAAALDDEMTWLVKRHGGELRKWIGDYPEALRPPRYSEDCIRCRLAALIDTHNAEKLINVKDVLERVIDDGDPLDPIIMSYCHTLKIPHGPWVGRDTIGVTSWVITKFLSLYDPSGRGGDAGPIARDIKAGKYTLDETMVRLCNMWADRGAKAEEWVGEFPLALRSSDAQQRALFPPDLAQLKETTPRGQVPQPIPQEVVLREQFKLEALGRMHPLPGVTEPVVRFDWVLQSSTTAEELVKEVNLMVANHCRQCGVPAELQYLWLQPEAPACMRYRFDRMLEMHAADSGRSSQELGTLRDELLHKVLEGEITLDAAVEHMATAVKAPVGQWTGPYPKALQKARRQRTATAEPKLNLDPAPRLDNPAARVHSRRASVEHSTAQSRPAAPPDPPSPPRRAEDNPSPLEVLEDGHRVSAAPPEPPEEALGTIRSTINPAPTPPLFPEAPSTASSIDPLPPGPLSVSVPTKPITQLSALPNDKDGHGQGEEGEGEPVDGVPSLLHYGLPHGGKGRKGARPGKQEREALEVLWNEVVAQRGRPPARGRSRSRSRSRHRRPSFQGTANHTSIDPIDDLLAFKPTRSVTFSEAPPSPSKRSLSIVASIRFRLTAFAVLHAKDDEVPIDDLIARVVASDRGPFVELDAVMRELCQRYVSTGAVPALWCGENEPAALVKYRLDAFFRFYDPTQLSRTVGLMEQVLSQTRTIDRVMTELCRKYADRGARVEEWVGQFPSALRRAMSPPPSPGRRSSRPFPSHMPSHHPGHPGGRHRRRHGSGRDLEPGWDEALLELQRSLVGAPQHVLDAAVRLGVVR